MTRAYNHLPTQDQVIAMLATGLKPSEIAFRSGVRYDTLRTFIKTHNLIMRAERYSPESVMKGTAEKVFTFRPLWTDKGRRVVAVSLPRVIFLNGKFEGSV